jgi:pSer/pThr/pTyr-binding forkhead associated (FHA) protein
VLVDLGSTNGTFVNGQPVRRVALSDGTHISLGRTTLVFRQDALDRQDGQGSAYPGSSY